MSQPSEPRPVLDIAAIRKRLCSIENLGGVEGLNCLECSDRRALCDEVEALRAELAPVYRCEECKFDYHAKILNRHTIQCPTCKSTATKIPASSPSTHGGGETAGNKELPPKK
jgi:hypothetical protein